ncbi:MAG: tRNA (N6-threonylcarbamoyladenosine(37)-N6)-methyltransferase TrmO, partial [Ktedonobacterales bacterium]
MPENMPDNDYVLRPIAALQSPLKQRDEAPRQGNEGAPDAWLDVDAAFADALDGLAVGDEV